MTKVILGGGVSHNNILVDGQPYYHARKQGKRVVK